MPSVGKKLWWFVIPAAMLYVFVVVVPTVQGGYMSLTDWSAFTNQRKYIGLANYSTLIHGDIGSAALRTVYIAGIVVVVENVLGLSLAVILNGRIFGRNILRTIIFAPVMVSPLVVGYLFQYLFGPPDSGGVNQLLAAIGLGQVDFLGNPASAFWIIIVTIVWQFTGVTMVIYLAGLQNVPAELLEAAAVDGANGWRRFWHITRPLLAPAITINLMLGLIGGLKLFDQVFALTGGGPASQTDTISTKIYELFSQLGYYGQSAALAVLLAIAVAVLSIFQYTALRRQERKLS